MRDPGYGQRKQKQNYGIIYFNGYVVGMKESR
jgi:hypothetical protein